MTEKDLPVFSVLQLWREALSKATCVLKFNIQGDGKTFDFDLKDESEYNCNDCTSEFCFKSLEWLEDCGDDGSTQLNIKTAPKKFEYERAYV